MSNAVGFSGVGLVNFHQRTVAGGKGIGRFVGNTSKLAIGFSPKSVERNSSMSVSRAPLRRMTQTTDATIEIVTDEFSKGNVAQALRARIDDIAADAATTINEVLPTGAMVGDVLSVSKRNITALVVTDSTVGNPKTLTLGVNYDVDLFSGDITLLNITTGGAFVQPFKAAFKQGAVSVLSGLVIADADIWISLAGTNADDDSRGMLDVYRVRLDPTKTLDFLSNDYVDFDLSGSVLQDVTKTPDAIGGQTFAWYLPADMA